MKQAQALFYNAEQTFLHQQPLTLKLVLLIAYGVMIFSVSKPLPLLLLCLWLTIGTSLLKLPLRSRLLVLLLIILLTLFTVTNTTGTFVEIVITIGKIVTLILLTSLFTMTTSSSDGLALLKPGHPLAIILHPLTYMMHTMFAVLPSVQYDLQRAIDAETLRRGGSSPLYSLLSWRTIISILLVRVSVRANRWVESVIERGFSFEQSFTPLTPQVWNGSTIIIFLLLLLPGALLFMRL